MATTKRASRMLALSLVRSSSTAAATTRASSSMSAVRTVQSSPYAQTHTSADVINFGIGQPSPSLLPLSLFQQAAQHRLQDTQDNALFQYGAGRGYSAFRRDLAAFLAATTSTAVDPDALMVTAGNSQAISHAAMVFTQHTKRVFVEAPTYFLAFDLFRELGLDLAAVPVDADGLDVDALEQRLRAGDVPAFVYTVPFFHNPTGAVLSATRRSRLLSLASAFGFRIISDEPYNLLGLDPTAAPLPSLASYDPSGQVVSLGSFSKILSPGLRLGWAQSSKETIRALASCGAIRSGGGQNPVTAGIVHSVLELNLLEPHIQELRRVFAARKAALCDALATRCPECSFIEPLGGYFVWLQLPVGVDAAQLLAQASADHGVAFTPGSRCVLPDDVTAMGSNKGGDASTPSRFARLSFAFYDCDEIALGVERLARALASYRHASSSSSS